MKRDWSQSMGSGATVGAQNYPAKYSFNATTANCASAAQPDYVVYGTGLTGSATQASIAAYDNLYAGCSGIVPMVYWAYNTGGTVTTSPVLSIDGTQIAFVQTDASGHGNLVLLRWAASATETIGGPLTLTRLPNSSYFGCAAPCMTSTVLTDSGGTADADTNSSVFYDYADDIAYVGDDAGWLHKITPVFNGVPAEVRIAGWPVQVNPGAPTALTSPVYDGTSGRVFLADTGGFLYRVGPGTAFVASSQLDFSSEFDGGPGIVQGPIIDSTAEVVYVFAPSDGTGGCPIGETLYDCAGVYELQVDFPGGNTGVEAVVGASTVEPAEPNPLYLGAFDSTYENSVNATGHLYVCGNTGGSPILYQVTIQGGVLGSVKPGPVLSTSISTPCSPVTDILNPNVSSGATEWIFASAQDGGASSACSSGGCVFNFKNTSWQASTAYTVGQEVLDSNLHTEVVVAAGTSAATAPFWNITLGAVTTDGGVQWLDQGPESAFTPAAWAANHNYPRGTAILDPSGNIELVTSTGTKKSGGTIPTFNSAPGGTTSDGTAGLVWTNAGAIATAALPAAGGASGIIIDNTVGSGTLAGASQVYFSTLSNQPCGTSGTGGCAVQASQSALK
jgi:hypothetical protein